MTTCIAVWTPEKAIMASDRRASSAILSYQHGRPKIEKVAPWLIIGAAGGSRALRFLDTWKLSTKTAPNNYLEARVTLQKSADALWSKNGWESDDSEDDIEAPEILMLTPWGIFTLSTGGTVWPLGGEEIVMGAVGSGSSFALGAAWALAEHEHSVDIMAKTAIQIASSLDPRTGDGIEILSF